jgi:hypothetical protein
LLAITILVGAFVSVGAASVLAGPITKQNGSTPVFSAFTSICSVAGYAGFGYCGGDPAKFSNVTGRVNAVQAKLDRWNLGLSFANLQPGAVYRLWGNQDGATPAPGVVNGFFQIGTATAGLDGTISFSYQTSNVSGLGFDLNILSQPWWNEGVTIVTSYWSQQTIKVLSADGTLYVPH